MPSVVRGTMADLIAHVRTMIGDPTGASAAFTDASIQDALDETRVDIQFRALEPRYTLVNGAYVWTDYYSPPDLGGFWENDETLYGLNYLQLTPTASDRVTGHWTFTGGAFPNGQVPPVIIYGKVYDVWRAAADLLEMWAATLATTAFDFSADGRSYHPSQAVNAKQALAVKYRKRARIRPLRVERADIGGTSAADRAAKYGPVSAGVPFLTGP